MENKLKSEKKHHHTQEVLVQLKMVIGNLESIHRMIQTDKSCVEIVRELAGPISALIDCRNAIAKDHIISCIRSNLGKDQEPTANELVNLFDELLGQPKNGSHH